MTYPYLLGKWRKKDPETGKRFQVRGFRLSQHISECMRMACIIMDDLPFGRRLHEVMGLSIPYAEFRKLVLLGVLLHDFGKACSEFQTMLWQLEQHWKATGESLRVDKRYRQVIRHEAVSAYLLLKGNLPFKAWLLKQVGGDPEKFDTVVAAAFGHHSKTDMAVKEELKVFRPKFQVYLTEMTSMLRKISAKYIGGDGFPLCDDITVATEDAEDLLEDWQHDTSQETPIDKGIKIGVLLSDMLGSLSPPKESELVGYHKVITEHLRVLAAPIQIDFVGRAKLEGKQLHPFQEQAAAAQGDALLVVPCGRGKTAASYLWAANRPDLSLVFTLPRTSAATQIHWDLRDKQRDLLRHSRTKVDTWLASNPAEPGEAEVLDEVADTLRSFFTVVDGKLQRAEIVHTTIDQVVGVMGWNYRSSLWLLYLLGSQIVFDEIGEYDSCLEGAYMGFLETFPGLRTTHMSATVSNRLQAEVKRRRPRVALIKDEGGPDHPSNWLRYRIHFLQGEQASAEAFRIFESTPKSALWVVNRVGVAQEIAGITKALCYHSRFRYHDGQTIRERLVKGFREPGSTLKVVSTQIAQSSFDISAGILVSEAAPVADMIQRLGRIARWLKENLGLAGVCDAYFYMPETAMPYPEHGPDEWRKWLLQMDGRVLSQKDLERAYLALKDGFRLAGFPRLKKGETFKRSIREDNLVVRGFLETDPILYPDCFTSKKVPKWGSHRVELESIQLSCFLSPKAASDLRAEGMYRGHRFFFPEPEFRYDPHRLGLLRSRR